MRKVIQKPTDQLALDFTVETPLISTVLNEARPACNTTDRHAPMPVLQVKKGGFKSQAQHRLGDQLRVAD